MKIDSEIKNKTQLFKKLTLQSNNAQKELRNILSEINESKNLKKEIDSTIDEQINLYNLQLQQHKLREDAIVREISTKEKIIQSKIDSLNKREKEIEDRENKSEYLNSLIAARQDKLELLSAEEKILLSKIDDLEQKAVKLNREIQNSMYTANEELNSIENKIERLKDIYEERLFDKKKIDEEIAIKTKLIAEELNKIEEVHSNQMDKKEEMDKKQHDLEVIERRLRNRFRIVKPNLQLKI